MPLPGPGTNTVSTLKGGVRRDADGQAVTARPMGPAAEVRTGGSGPRSPPNRVPGGSQADARGVGHVLRERRILKPRRMGQAGGIPGRGRTGPGT